MSLKTLSQSGVLGHWFCAVTAGAIDSGSVVKTGCISSVNRNSAGNYSFAINQIEWPYGIHALALGPDGGESTPIYAFVGLNPGASYLTGYITFYNLAGVVTEPEAFTLAILPT